MNKRIKHTMYTDKKQSSRKRRISTVALFILLVLSISKSIAQVIYPVQSITQVIAPYTSYVPSLYSGTQNKLRVTLTNLDMQEPTLQVYLRMKITSSTFSITTPPEVYTQVINLPAGVPVQLTSHDLAVYFDKSNMRISGGQSKFYQTMQLPDNFYRFQFEVYEQNTNRLLSNPNIGFAQMMIASGEPPILNLPLKGATIKESNIPSIFFSWTPRHMNSIASAYGTEYQFSLVEIYDKNTDPSNAFQYSRVLYTETTRSTSFIHTAAQPMLQAGMRYAWRVRAIAREGLDEANVFTNNGYSPISWFDYTIDCPVVQESGVVVENMIANITWTQTKAIDYTLEYRKKGSTKWYTGNVTNNNLCKIYNLQPSETYEYRIGTRCQLNDNFEYTQAKAFTMPQAAAKSPKCGLVPNINITDRTPIKELIPGTPVFAGDFPVTIVKTSGSGTFSGEGYVSIPYMGYTKIGVQFKNITVNSQYQLLSGYFETKFDLNNNMIIDLDQVTTGGKGVGDVRSGDELADFTVPYTIDVHTPLKPLTGDTLNDDIQGSTETTITQGENGKYNFALTDTQGNEHKIASETLPLTIKDQSNTIYQINQDGSLEVISQTSSLSLDPLTKDKIRYDIADVTFVTTPNTRYALDVYQDVYQTVTEYYQTYKPKDRDGVSSAKFMIPNTTDEILVKLESIKKEDFDTQKVRIVTSAGKEYPVTYNAKAEGWYLNILSSEQNEGQELYVVYQLEDNTLATLAHLNIYCYNPKNITIKLVPVNGYGKDIQLSKIEQELNAIYNPVGIFCKVELADNFRYTALDNKAFQVEGSGLFSTQTNDMKQLNAAYQQAHGNQKDICLFMIQQVEGNQYNNQKIAGDMPRAHQFGYLFEGFDAQTIAHEIGHGIFHLDHPFARATGSKSFASDALTDNLMHYHKGTKLVKLQWDAIHAPGLVLGVFETDKDGMSDRVKDINVFLKWLKDNIGNENVSYNQNSFYDGHVVFDHAIKVKDLGITLYIDFGKSGNLNLGKTETGGIPAFGVDFELDNKYHNGFYFKIRYKDQTGDAIKIWFYSYEHFASFMSYLGIKINDSVKDHLITLYKELIEKAGNDCDKLDVIYETIPDFVAKAIPDETLYKNIESLGGCSIGNYNWKRLWWGATDEVQALINILNGFDKKWIYQKINNSPDFFEKLLREKVGVRANSIDKFILTISQIAAENWEESDLAYQDCIIIGGQKINVTNDYEKLYRLGVSSQLVGIEQSVFVNGCCPTQIGSYNFGNQILIENPMFAAGSIFGCTNHIQKKSLAPIYILQDADEDLILPAVVAKYLLEDATNKAFWEIVNLHLGMLMPEVLIKPATLTKWSKFFKAKSGTQAGNVSDDVIKAFTNRLNSSIAEVTGFTQIHTKEEIAKIITKGRELGLRDNVIEDLLHISCRDAKSIKASDLMQQMDNYVNVVLKRGYPYKFNSKAEFDKFKGELKKGLDDIGISTADVRIQGSSLRTPSANDVDLVVFLDEISFNRAIINRFSNRITKNNQKIDLTNKSTQELIEIADDYQINRSLYNNQTDSFSRAMKGQKFSAYSNDKIVPKLTDLYKQLKQKYPELNIENISVQTVNTSFDLNPFIKL